MLFSLIKRDIIYSLYENKKKFLLVITFYLILIIVYIMQYRMPVQGFIGMVFIASPLDMFMNFFGGIGYPPPQAIQFPYFWMIWFVLLGLINGSYAVDDLKNNGFYVLLRTESIKTFWASKVIWCILNVLIFSVMVFWIVGMGSLFLSNHNLEFGFDSFRLLVELSGFQVLIYLFGLMVVSSIGISLLQMTLSLIFKPIYGYLIIMGLLFASIYVYSPWMLGQQGIILRHDIFAIDHSVSLVFTLVYMAIISIISVIGGYVYIKIKDII